MSVGPAADTVSIAERAVATLSVPGYVDFLAADGRGVWATNTDRVERFEVGQPGPVATVAVPGACGGMVVADGALWVAGCKDQAVHRVDLQSRTVVASVRTGLADADGELSLAAGAGSIWILSDARGVLTRIDGQKQRDRRSDRGAPSSYCAAFGFGAVWITNSAIGDAPSAGSAQRIDPVAEQVTATIRTGPDPRFLAAGEGGVWTLNWADGSVTRIDPSGNTAINLPLGMLGGGGDIATGAGRVWVRGADTLLATIDPTTNLVDQVYGPPEGSGAVRVAEDLVWVTAHDTKTLWVLDASSRA